MSLSTDSTGQAWPTLESSHIQFLERSFPEWLGMAGRGSQVATLEEDGLALLHWLHDAIFVQGRKIEVVRNELFVASGGMRFLAVSSGKGGVGKTTCSVNLAFALASEGHRVLLVDADLGLGNLHVFAGVNPKVSLQDFFDNKMPIQNALTAINERLWILCGASGVASLANLDLRRINRLMRHLRGLKRSLDYVIIDTGAGISSQVLNFLMQAQEIILVTTPNIAATLDVYGMVKTIHEQGMGGRIRLLINQCADEAEAIAVAGKICDCSQQFLGIAPELLGYLTRSSRVEQSNQDRAPFVARPRKDANGNRVLAMARILAQPAPPPETLTTATALQNA